MPTTTIKSTTQIVYNRGLERYKKGFDILFNASPFKKSITYRRYVLGNDNLSGDKNYADYNDYEIYVELQFEGETKNVSDAGYIISSGGFIYLPYIIQKDKNNNEIPAFRPQIKDEFQYQGKWYILQNMQPNQFTQSGFSMECFFSLISDGENPR